MHKNAFFLYSEMQNMHKNALFCVILMQKFLNAKYAEKLQKSLSAPPASGSWKLRPQTPNSVRRPGTPRSLLPIEKS